MRSVMPALAGCALLVAPSGLLNAAALRVSPLTISIPPDGSPQVVRVQNQGSQEVLVHVAAVEWTHSGRDGESVKADEVLVVPPIFRVKPDATQVIRLALRSPLKEPEEKTYRLLITEVPETIVPINGVTFALRMNLPVFVTPKGAGPDPVWSIREAADGGAELVLRNEGEAHLRLSGLELRKAGDPAPLFATDKGMFALPGEEQVWRLDDPIHAPPQMLEVHAETQLGRVPVPYAGPSH